VLRDVLSDVVRRGLLERPRPGCYEIPERTTAGSAAEEAALDRAVRRECVLLLLREINALLPVAKAPIRIAKWHAPVLELEAALRELKRDHPNRFRFLIRCTIANRLWVVPSAVARQAIADTAEWLAAKVAIERFLLPPSCQSKAWGDEPPWLREGCGCGPEAVDYAGYPGEPHGCVYDAIYRPAHERLFDLSTDPYSWPDDDDQDDWSATAMKPGQMTANRAMHLETGHVDDFPVSHEAPWRTRPRRKPRSPGRPVKGLNDAAEALRILEKATAMDIVKLRGLVGAHGRPSAAKAANRAVLQRAVVTEAAQIAVGALAEALACDQDTIFRLRRAAAQAAV
jgi:hypothetical protein